MVAEWRRLPWDECNGGNNNNKNKGNTILLEQARARVMTGMEITLPLEQANAKEMMRMEINHSMIMITILRTAQKSDERTKIKRRKGIKMKRRKNWTKALTTRIVPFMDTRNTFTDGDDASSIHTATSTIKRLLKPSITTKPMVEMCGVAFKYAIPSNAESFWYCASSARVPFWTSSSSKGYILWTLSFLEILGFFIFSLIKICCRKADGLASLL